MALKSYTKWIEQKLWVPTQKLFVVPFHWLTGYQPTAERKGEVYKFYLYKNPEIDLTVRLLSLVVYTELHKYRRRLCDATVLRGRVIF